MNEYPMHDLKKGVVIMNEIRIELSDEDMVLLEHICDEEGCDYLEFVTVMIRSFVQLSPFHLDTLKMYVD